MIDGAGREWTPAVDVDGAMDDIEDHYALTRAGRTIHIVRGELRRDTDIIGRAALCGLLMNRLIHPSDTGPMCRVCQRNEDR